MLTVLHVDNSSLFKRLLKEAFVEQKCHYLSAGGMREALDVLESAKVDLVLTALELEDGSGEELLRLVSTGRFRSVPVVILSSYDSIEMRERMFSLGAVDFIPKDISHDKLLVYVEKIARRDVLEQQLREMRIAVLDDSATALNMVKNILGLSGMAEADYYDNAEDFLNCGREYDIYLIDVILPGVTGDFIVYETRKKHPNAVILAVSAIDHYNTMSSLLLSGADDYIMKPFDTGMFMARIKANMRTSLLMKELEAKNRELSELVVRDSLTKIFNHKYLYERLENEIREAVRYKRPLSIAMFDIDDFKKINDTYGHQAGDAVLASVSDAIVASVRDVDIVGRYGGEEFMIIFPETMYAEAVLTSGRVRAGIEALAFPGKDIRVTVSGGVAELGKREEALDLIERADARLYEAKRQGKNRIC